MTTIFPPSHRPGLFRSAAWLHAWHCAWSNHPHLTVVSESDAEFKRESFPALYSYDDKRFLLGNVCTLFPAGISTAATPSLRSEYFLFNDPALIKSYLQTALDFSWDQFYIPDLLMDSVDYRELVVAASQLGLQLLIHNTATTYGVDLRHNNFQTYLSTLGKNTRLKLYNKRRRLESLGELQVRNIWPDIDTFFTLLNEFHLARWGKPCYSGRNQIMIEKLLRRLQTENRVIDCSVMTLNAKPVSVVFDIHIEGRIYNLQSGYREHFRDGISLGTLHFGYQIEAAFNNPHADYYDFMAGTGKVANYKAAIANAQAEFVSVCLVRSPTLKVAYKMNTLFRRIVGFLQKHIAK